MRSSFLSIADISLFSALLAGALSFLSPCVLPLVPPYLCYMAGVSVEQFRTENTAPRPEIQPPLVPARAGTQMADSYASRTRF